MATPKRTGGAKPDVIAGDTPAGRRAAKRAQGPATGDDDRQRAYRQGGAAAKRARDERGRGRRARGPAQVHDDPELQDIYEQGHHDSMREARRTTVTNAIAGPAGSARSVGENGAGFVLGLIAFALFRNYLTGGWSGVGKWFSAKFTNNTSLSSAPATLDPSSPDNAKSWAWIAAHPGKLPHPNAGPSDYWNQAARNTAAAAGNPIP